MSSQETQAAWMNLVKTCERGDDVVLSWLVCHATSDVSAKLEDAEDEVVRAERFGDDLSVYTSVGSVKKERLKRAVGRVDTLRAMAGFLVAVKSDLMEVSAERFGKNMAAYFRARDTQKPEGKLRKNAKRSAR